MKSRTAAQSKALFATLRAQGIDDDTRAELVRQYTNGRSASSRDLTYDEARALLEALNGPRLQAAAQAPATPPGGHALNQLRRYLMSLAIQAGYYTQRQGRPVCDLARLQAWIDRYGVHKGELNRLNKQQVNDLCRQMEQYARKMVNDE